MAIVVAKHRGIGFRVFEREMLEKHFDEVNVCLPEEVGTKVGAEDYLYWLLPTEDVEWSWLVNHGRQEAQLKTKKIINPLPGYLACHEKDRAFVIWKCQGIPCPVSFSFDSKERLFKKLNGWDFPVLLRLNNRTNGDATYFVEDPKDLNTVYGRLEEDFLRFKDRGIGTRKLCVQFIDTREYGYYYSYRIIVAGDKILTGYARLSNDWLAITRQFEPAMWEPFLHHQSLCQNFCLLNEDLIVKAVFA